MKMNIALKVLFIICLISAVSETVLAHAGSHGNDECTVLVGKTELRLSGYQFKGRNPDRHYCRHYPHLAQTIIKIDSVSADLSNMAIDVQLLKRNSWLGLVLNTDDAFSVLKQQPIQYFSKQVVTIESDIQARDIYAIKLRLHNDQGDVDEQQFMFFVGLPFAQIMVAIAVLLLLFLAFIVFRQWWSKWQEQ